MKNRIELLERIPKGGVTAELGVFTGEFSDEIVKIIQPKTHYMVDIFQGLCTVGIEGISPVITRDMAEVYSDLALKYADDPVRFVKKSDSISFLNNPDVFVRFDFVYIDTVHTYDYTIKELEAAYKAVKVGGYIAGHDHCAMFDGVRQAVREFCLKYDLTAELTTDEDFNSFLIQRR